MINHLSRTVGVTCAAIWALVLSGNGWVIPYSVFLPLSIMIGMLSLLLLAARGRGVWPAGSSLIRQPDLSGTWKGVIQSSWKGDERATNQGVIHAYITIAQTSTSLILRLFTLESQSVTLTASLTSESDEHHVVSALYRNNPRLLVRPHNAIHYGGILLQVGGEHFDKLVGSYWTDRQTSGEMQFRRASRKLFTDYEAADAALSSVD